MLHMPTKSERAQLVITESIDGEWVAFVGLIFPFILKGNLTKNSDTTAMDLSIFQKTSSEFLYKNSATIVKLIFLELTIGNTSF